MVALLVVLLTALMALVLLLPPLPDGPLSTVVVSVTDSNGLHVLDLPAVACWLVGLWVCARLWRD